MELFGLHGSSRLRNLLYRVDRKYFITSCPLQAKYIAQCIEEIKQELRQDNVSVKSNAVAKLTYLQMCGYDISWAGFNIIEVMSSNRFTCKRIGYLAASQCFHPDSELLMLTTNMIRKDLSSTNQYDAGVALSGLSCFISTDLSRDLANDIMTLVRLGFANGQKGWQREE